MKLERYIKDGLELYVDRESGRAYATRNGILRMLGTEVGSEGTIRNRLRGANIEKIEAEIQTEGGIQGGQLYSSEVIYDLALEFNHDLARAMGASGANTYLLGLAGYKTLITESSIESSIESSEKKRRRDLPSRELVAAREIREITDLLTDNPRLAQVLIDSRMNEIIEKQLNRLRIQDEKQEVIDSKWRGVVEIAQEMGYKTNLSNRVQLGQFIASQGLESKKEKRLCNGIQMPINCYKDSEEIRKAIESFFTK